MRRLFNNPKIVLPLALVSGCIIAYRVAPGAFQSVINFMPDMQRENTVAYKKEVDQHNSGSEAIEYMGALLRERWLPNRWRQFARIQGDPFVADYIEPEQPDLPEIIFEEEPLPPLPEDIATYIVENIGLDDEGFFVRFGRQRIREGGMLGSEVVHQISVPGLNGDALTDALDRLVPALKLDATAPDAEPPSAVINGNYLIEGDLVSRRPVLAIGQVAPDKVMLLDREGRNWWLYLDE